MINAQEASESATDRSEEWFAVIEQQIRKAASKGKYGVIIRQEPMCSWVKFDRIRDDLDRDSAAVIAKLKKEGFAVSGYYNGSNYFADTGLHIEW